MTLQESTLRASDGTPLFLRVWKPAEEPRAVLILVHGLGEHAGRYPHVVETFLPQNYVIFGHDHRGFGRSGGKKGDLRRYDDLLHDLDQVVDLARKRYPGLPVAMYGHSMGGTIVTSYLAGHQDKVDAAVISAPGYGPGPDFSKLMLLMSRILYRLAPGLSIHTGAEENLQLSHDPAVQQAYKDDPYVHDIVTPRFSQLFLDGARKAQRLLPQLSLPILLIMGEEDKSINQQAVIDAAAQAGPNLTFRRYAGSYHELHNEIPEIRQQALDDVQRWLAGTLFGS